MASEQIRTRKKKARNLTQEENCHQILYRHQDCIPDPKLLHSCEKHRLFGVKSNQQDNFEHKLLGIEELSDLRTKQLNTKPKNTKQFEKRFQETELNPNCNSADKTNEELSKSRKRRIRKRRLLTSLAPLRALTNRQSENIAKAKSDCNTCPSNGIHSVPIVNHNDSDLSKTSPKNSRKRFDKSVTLRNKNIKSKTLVDCTNQSKSDIIKSIEEKTLNSLLQTLAPLTNASPKKEKIPTTPIFSFPEKRLNLSDTKVDKDGVFYFGETKHQLEKVTLELNKCSTSAQNNQLDSNSSVNKLNNTANCGSILNDSPSYNDSLCNITQLISTDLVHLNNLDNIVPFSFRSSDISPKELEIALPYQENQNQLTSRQLDSRKPDSCTSLTSLTSAIVPSKSIIVASENINKSTEKTQHLCNTSLLKLEETNIEQKEIKKESSVVKSSNETMKTNKTRDEVLLEREAKKAAKLAAKSKNKTNQNKKDAGDSDTKNTNSSETVKLNFKETKVENVEIKLSDVSSTPGRDENKLATTDQVLISSENKIIREEVLVDPSTSTGEKDVPAKSKAELKAERRAKQEAQRAAKAVSRTSEPQEKKLPQKTTPQIKNEPSKPDTKSSQQEKKSEVPKLSTQPKPKLFSHLYQQKSPASSNKIMKLGKLHPAIVRLGVQYAKRVVVGSNARCVALLHALKQMIKDYSTPSEKEFSRGLEEELGPVMVYLNQCRPLAVSMTNAIKHIKRSLVQLPNTISDVEARRKMRDLVDTYIQEQIDVAGKAICESVGLKIANGDVILTYGCSSLVCQILVESHLKGKKFRVVVVDGLPWQEGREMLRRLVDKGVSCTYVLISAASFIMREASKVLLGAHALLANGYVMSRAGSSQVALLAHCYNVPVLVCCETHKFSERVQTDAFVYNELGELCCGNIKDKDSNRVTANLTPLSLAYDITPPDLVSAVVTERAILPCTSVPVILRIKPSESVM